jgi:hypothetical protein
MADLNPAALIPLYEALKAREAAECSLLYCATQPGDPDLDQLRANDRKALRLAESGQ